MALPATGKGNRWASLYHEHSGNRGKTVQIITAGDIMVGRSIAEACVRKKNFNYPFEGITPFIKSDIFIGNLESPLTQYRPRKSGSYMLKAPVDFAPFLKFCDHTVYSLANNHSLDAGPEGLKECIDVLGKNNIFCTGAGKNSAQSPKGVKISVKGISFQILAFNTVMDPEDSDHEGDNYCRAWFNENAMAEITKAKNNSDYVVVVMHWGEEYTRDPDRNQIMLAQKIIRAGADIILGSHPHVVQRTEIVNHGGRKRVILYSLGNFIFDQYKSRETENAFIVRITVNRKKILSVEKLPVFSRRAGISVSN
ncbi:MAG TPA: CapA family protein [Spirochaetota bacterium]|nr:CapA family protein [Spirochaetota bacterium]